MIDIGLNVPSDMSREDFWAWWEGESVEDARIFLCELAELPNPKASATVRTQGGFGSGFANAIYCAYRVEFCSV